MLPLKSLNEATQELGGTRMRVALEIYRRSYDLKENFFEVLRDTAVVPRFIHYSSAILTACALLFTC